MTGRTDPAAERASLMIRSPRLTRALRREFKARCSERGETMTDVLMAFVERFARKGCDDADRKAEAGG